MNDSGNVSIVWAIAMKVLVGRAYCKDVPLGSVKDLMQNLIAPA